MIKRSGKLLETRRRRREELARDSDDEYEGLEDLDGVVSSEDEASEEEAEAAATDAAVASEGGLSLRGTRVLLLGSRGVTEKHRVLMRDLGMLLPQVRQESRMDPRDPPRVINEIGELRSCNHAMFLDCRRHTDLYWDFARIPDGPTLRFFVRELHTADELNLTGNCLRGSRALLSFSKEFDTEPRWRIAKTILGEIFAVPRLHPRSKPFIDHVFMFSVQGGLVYFRNYQIVDHGERRAQDRHLVEVGPRFTLEPVRFFENGFGGRIIYENYDFVSPNAVRHLKRLEAIERSARDLAQKKKGEEIRAKARRVPTELDTLFN